MPRAKAVTPPTPPASRRAGGASVLLLVWLAGCAGEPLAPAADPAPGLAAARTTVTVSPPYVMTVLPLDAVSAINSSGAVVGRVGGDAALYAGGTLSILPKIFGFSNLAAVDIADNGMIVGYGTSAGKQRGLVWANATATPAVMASLGDVTTPRSITSGGVVVGSFQATATSPRKAFRWTAATGMVSLAPLGTSASDAVDISDPVGYIAGTAEYFALGHQVVRWRPDGTVNRITMTGEAYRARNDGSILGFGANGATVWSLLNVATPVGPKPATHAVKQISSLGRYVGIALGSNPVPWTAFGTADTANYLPVPPRAVGGADDVNTCGTAIGTIKLINGTFQRVIWSKSACDAPLTR